jgi:hypothetical protein
MEYGGPKMANDALSLKLSGVLDGYAVRKIHLEEEVKASGYTPVMESLLSLAATQQNTIVENPSAEFLGALSPKSKGLMLTSALLTDNTALYTPLYAEIDKSIAEVYPQDLTSLLGGSHAPKALSEMTKRACQDMSILRTYNAGLNQIKASQTGDTALAHIKADITDSSWTEKHPNETRNFLTLVDAVPETKEVETLKRGPLARYLAAGLKLAAVATVMAGVGLAAIYGGSFIKTSSGVGYVNLDTRPAIETVMSKDKVETRKILQAGEFDSKKLLGNYLEHLQEKSIGDALHSFNNDQTVGVAHLYEKGRLSDEAICIVSYEQTAPVSHDGHFSEFGDQPGMIVEKNLHDFFVKSHETGHCFFQVDNTDGGIRELDVAQYAYQRSLEEIYGDLVAILDYMHETGTNDLYANYLRPSRISYIKDTEHKTAWALDEILPDIDPAAIHMKDKTEIPQIAKHLMEKHFMNKNGSYYPGEMAAGTEKLIDTPASKAMWEEIRSARKLELKRFDDPRAQKLASDIHDSLAKHHAKYQGIASKSTMDKANAGYEIIAAKYNLKPLEIVEVAPAKLARQQESLLSRYL